MARHLAKNIVANGYARKCEIQLSYAIGIAEPVSIFIETFGTATIPEEEIMKKIKAKFNLTPKANNKLWSFWKRKHAMGKNNRTINMKNLCKLLAKQGKYDIII